VAGDVQVTDEDLRGAYEQAKAGYNLPEKRSAEVVLAVRRGEAKALGGRLAERAWTGPRFRPPHRRGGTPVDLTDPPRTDPSPELAEAVFAAAPNAVARRCRRASAGMC